MKAHQGFGNLGCDSTQFVQWQHRQLHLVNGNLIPLQKNLMI